MEAISYDHKIVEYPNERFFSWLKANTALFLGQLAALGSLLLFIGSFAYYVLGLHAGETNISIDQYLSYTQKTVLILNMIFCLLFVVFAIYIFQKNYVGYFHSRQFINVVFGIKNYDQLQTENEALKLQKKLKLNFIYYWAFLFVFYTYLVLTDGTETDGKNVATSLLNSMLFIAPYWMFSIISKSKKIGYSVESDPADAGNNATIYSSKFPIIVWLTGVIGLGLFYFFLEVNYKTSISDFLKIANGLSGLINMVVFGLLISRLDSKLIGLPSWLVFILFFYAAVQPLDVFIDQTDLQSKMFTTINYMIVLIFKVYFFFIITYLFQTGRIFSFLQSNGIMSSRMRKIQEKVPSFRNWRKSYILLIDIVPILSVVTALLWFGSKPDNYIFKIIIPTANFIFCAIAALYLVKKNLHDSANDAIYQNYFNKFFGTKKTFKDNSPIDFKKRTKKIKAFFFFIFLFFITTGIYYFLDIFCPYKTPNANVFSNSMLYWSMCLAIVNMLSGLFLFFAFVVLYLPSRRDQDEKKGGHHIYHYAWTIFILITIIYISASVKRTKYNYYYSGDIAFIPDNNISSYKAKINILTNPVIFNDYKSNNYNNELSHKEKDKKTQRVDSASIELSGNILSDPNISPVSLINIAGKLKTDEHAKPQTKAIARYDFINDFSFVPFSGSADSNNFFELRIKPFLKDTHIYLPTHLYLYDSTARLFSNILSVTRDTTNKIFPRYSLVVYINSILQKDTVYNPASAKLYIRRDYLLNNSILQLPPYIAIGVPVKANWLMQIMDAISGVFNALVLCLVISRLNSKFFRLHNYHIAILFLYAGLQVFFATFHHNSSIFTIIIPLFLFLALILKIYLFLLLLYLCHGKRFHIYFGFFKELDKRAGCVFENQFEFVPVFMAHPGHYLLHINHENKTTFTSDSKFTSYLECIRCIAFIQQKCRDTNLLQLHNELHLAHGVHRLMFEIYFNHQRITFYSYDFKNKHGYTEMEHLAAEQLGYCTISTKK